MRILEIDERVVPLNADCTCNELILEPICFGQMRYEFLPTRLRKKAL